MKRPASDLAKNRIIRILQTHAEVIRGFGIERLGLFGSVVRGEAGPHSDIDILVQFAGRKKTFDNFMNLASFLEETLGRPVDLVTTEGLSPFLGPRILRETEYVPLSR